MEFGVVELEIEQRFQSLLVTQSPPARTKLLNLKHSIRPSKPHLTEQIWVV
jgi:hypothetical protein